MGAVVAAGEQGERCEFSERLNFVAVACRQQAKQTDEQCDG